MYSRILKPPKGSAFLLGPRGTGKSTWVKHQFMGDRGKAAYYDLLSTKDRLRLSRDPNLFYQELSAIPRGSWVVVDEVQRVPALLDEVHRLIEERRLKFLLTGSSARRLKKESTNLLAGRAIHLEMFPFVFPEFGKDYRLDQAATYLKLPANCSGDGVIQCNSPPANA